METDPSFRPTAIRRVLWWYAVSLFLILLLLFVLFLLLWFFLRPIHLGHREGIVRIALPLSPWNRKRGGTVWENPALLSRDVPEVGP